jgi:hypothetical protein
MRYAQYGYQDRFSDVPTTYGGFAIVQTLCGDGSKGVFIKQRNGKGSSPFLFDLPGGGRQGDDQSLSATASRELHEELGITSCSDNSIAIGSPLWLPIIREGQLVRVDCAQAFLVDAGTEEPAQTEEAINIATVNEESVLGFSVVGLRASEDPATRLFGRTPIMLWDGISVVKPPFFRLEDPSPDERARLEERFGSHLSEDIFLPIDNGNYLARMNNGAIEVHLRLNPFEPKKRFEGSLEDLAQG